MKGDIPFCLGYRAHHGKSYDRRKVLPVEQSVADYQCGTSPFLLVSRLWIKSQNHEITFLRNITGHLPDFLPNRPVPIQFFNSVLFGHL